jgi:hypothetical protein
MTHISYILCLVVKRILVQGKYERNKREISKIYVTQFFVWLSIENEKKEVKCSFHLMCYKLGARYRRGEGRTKASANTN